MLAIQLIGAVICGIIAAAIASGKGRSVPGWFFGGFFLGIIGVIIVACLSNVNAERAYKRQVEMANHRLREQLRQERMKGEAFRQYSAQRLDAHDQALGVDTRTLGPMLGAAPNPQLTSESPGDALSRLASGADAQPQPEPVNVYQQPQTDGQAQQAEHGGDYHTQSWYFAHGGQSFGPVTGMQIVQMLRDGSLDAQSLLWIEGMADWAPAAEVPLFRNAVNS